MKANETGEISGEFVLLDSACERPTKAAEFRSWFEVFPDEAASGGHQMHEVCSKQDLNFVGGASLGNRGLFEMMKCFRCFLPVDDWSSTDEVLDRISVNGI